MYTFRLDTDERRLLVHALKVASELTTGISEEDRAQVRRLLAQVASRRQDPVQDLDR